MILRVFEDAENIDSDISEKSIEMNGVKNGRRNYELSYSQGRSEMKLYIKYLRFIGQTKRQERMVKVGLSNGAIVKIVACYEGWQQYSATVEEKKVAMPIAERFNDWLHGGEFPH